MKNYTEKWYSNFYSFIYKDFIWTYLYLNFHFFLFYKFTISQNFQNFLNTYF